MAEFKSLREIAAEAVYSYRQKKYGLTTAEALAYEEAQRRCTAAAIKMEELISRDHEFLKRLGIRT